MHLMPPRFAIALTGCAFYPIPLFVTWFRDGEPDLPIAKTPKLHGRILLRFPT
jgi:hypothetical protein